MIARTIATVAASALLVGGAALPADARSHGHHHHRTPAPVSRTYHYGRTGIRVHDVRQVDRLRGASDSFKDFAVREARRSQDKQCDTSLYIETYSTSGYATGSIFAPGCGGTAAMWAKQGGAWGDVWEGQYQPTCAELSKAAGRHIPRGVLGCR